MSYRDECLTPGQRNPSMGVPAVVPYLPRRREPAEYRHICVHDPDKHVDFHLTVSPDGEYALCDLIVLWIDGEGYESRPGDEPNGERRVGAYVMRELEWEFRRAMGWK